MVGHRLGGPAPGTVDWGTSQAGDRFGPGELEFHPFPLTRARHLNELEKDLTFFTLAPLYWYCNFHDGPLTDFLVATEWGAKFYSQSFAHPLFRGFERGQDTQLNHHLWAIDAPFSEVFFAFLTSCKFMRYAERIMWGVGYQPFQIADPLASLTTDAARLNINVLGITSPEGQFALAPGPAPRDLPQFTQFDPDPAVVAFTHAFFEGQDPHDAAAAVQRALAKETMYEVPD